MNLTHKILEDGNLKIEADEATVAELREMRTENPDDFGSDYIMHEVFEDLTANSDLEWIDPAECGDLTDAPILGIRGEEYATDEMGCVGQNIVGRWPDENGVLKTWIRDVVFRWGFMDYAVRSVLDDLADQGYAIFQAPN